MRDGGMFAERRFDFCRFDPVAANLDLLVAPSKKHERAVGCPAPAIAGSEHECPTARRPQVRNEPRRGQRGLAKIADSQTRACDADLANAAHGDRFQPLVEDVDRRVGDRGADRHVTRFTLIVESGGVECSRPATLRQAVDIRQPRPLKALSPGAQQARVQPFTAADRQRQRRPAFELRVRYGRDSAPERRDTADMRNAPRAAVATTLMGSTRGPSCSMTTGTPCSSGPK
jgi:hypothetical protein